jgi:hypothetical protein
MFQLHLACAFFSILTNFQLAEYNHGVLLKMKTKVQLPVVGSVQLAMAGTNVHSQVRKNQVPGHVAILELAISDRIDQ